MDEAAGDGDDGVVGVDQFAQALEGDGEAVVAVRGLVVLNVGLHPQEAPLRVGQAGADGFGLAGEEQPGHERAAVIRKDAQGTEQVHVGQLHEVVSRPGLDHQVAQFLHADRAHQVPNLAGHWGGGEFHASFGTDRVKLREGHPPQPIVEAYEVLAGLCVEGNPPGPTGDVDHQDLAIGSRHDLKLDANVGRVGHALAYLGSLILRRNGQRKDAPGNLVADAHDEPAAPRVADADSVLSDLMALNERGLELDNFTLALDQEDTEVSLGHFTASTRMRRARMARFPPGRAMRPSHQAASAGSAC